MLKVSKCVRNVLSIRNYAKKSRTTSEETVEMKYLNVAEKHDAAKTIAGLLSNGSASRREGYSVYNKVFDFDATVRGNKSRMVMTSVSGHLLQLEFLNSYRNWSNVDPSSLFDAPVRKTCSQDYQPVKRTLEREIRGCDGLIIWTDCDREGENIGFEIVDVCRAIKPRINVYRAKFSEITGTAVRRALQQLSTPDKRQSEAVDVRTELDLRTGAAITRFQTMRLQRLFPEKIADKLISYGSCQIPTLGFVAERYKEIEAFVSEPFWKIKVIHTIDDLTVEFHWARNRLFDKQACEDYYLLCLADPQATVTSVTVKPKSKWRPTPLDTVELEKLGSRKLKLSAKETMTIAEKLYTKGYISYPRTETNQFSKEMDLRSLVEQQTEHSVWGAFAQRVIEWGPNPRNGNKSDQAHPPIHPTKLVTDLNGNEARVYELVCRHFLATVSKDAVGSETIVKINIAGEEFAATGLCIYERNYLDVYIYDKWNAKQIHNYAQDQTFEPTEISMPEGATTPPALLTEADLIALMEKHGIGTDATHAEHINTIKERGYIGVVDKGFLVPGVIGMGLYEGYDAMQLALAKPLLRAAFEEDLKKICSGDKDPKAVLQEHILKYKEAYKQIMEKITAMDEKMALRINETPSSSTRNGNDNAGNANVINPSRVQEIFQCPKCDVAPLALKPRKNQNTFMIGCLNYPECKNVIWLPEECQEPSVSDETCTRCGEGFKLLKFKLSTAYYKVTFDTPTGWYKTCLRCDNKFRETFNINLESVKRVGRIVAAASANSVTTMSVASTVSRSANTNTNQPDNPGNAFRTGNDVPSSSHSSTNTRNTTNRRNNKKSTDDEPKRAKKATTKTKSVTGTGANIRNFFTDSAQTSTQSAVPATITESTTAAELDVFFNSNDSFDTLLLAAEGTRTNGATASNNNQESGDFSEDIAAAFADDDDDWGILNTAPTSTASINRETASNSIITNPISQRHDTSANDSITELFRNDFDYNNFAWGSAERNRRAGEGCENKRPRLQEPQSDMWETAAIWESPTITESPRNDTESQNYSWGSKASSTTTAATGSTAPAHNVKCTGCHQLAKELFVKKDGPNKGRMFYACSKSNPCKFFQWADEAATSISSNVAVPQTTPTRNRTVPSSSWGTSSQTFRDSTIRNNTTDNFQNTGWGSTTSNRGRNNTHDSTTGSSTNANDAVKCNCGVAASSLTVRKDGPNKGRPFHGCAQRNCNFFQWGDASDSGASTSADARASNQSTSWGTGTRQNGTDSQNPDNERNAKKRKCGLCRQEGHTKQKCPRKAEFDYLH